MSDIHFCVWAQVSDEVPWQEWQPKLFEHFKWPQDVVIEKWNATEAHWPKILDSCNSFTLFKQAKVIVILNADKALKDVKHIDLLMARFKKGPHKILFQSENQLPASIKIPFWQPEVISHEKTNEKAAFQWIDHIHSNQLTAAIATLDQAIQNGQHPLALVQLITRDFRMGRLIHYANQSRIREAELSTSLRVPGFVIQKWLRRQNLPKSHWSHLFDRLLESDLELKSGADGVWVLRKLTFDLVQLTHAHSAKPSVKTSMKKFKRPLQPAPLLWTISPSYA